MNAPRSLVLVAALGFGLLQAGCFGSADDVGAKGIEMPGSETLDGPDGTGSTNGLGVRELQVSIPALLDAMSYGIYGSYPEVSQDVLDTGLLDEDEGRAAFKYAMNCGLNSNLSVTYNDEYKPFEGGGILRTTSGWTTGPLTLGAKEDLFACMMAHVNPSNFAIPILLKGDNVYDDGGAHNEFIYPEAVMQATISASGGVHFDIWPHPAFVHLCTGDDPFNMFAARLCAHGDPEVNCGATIHSSASLATDCEQDEDYNYSCGGKPAIETWLSETGITELHPTCIAPQ
jgi:hypothetical protein